MLDGNGGIAALPDIFHRSPSFLSGGACHLLTITTSLIPFYHIFVMLL